MRKFKRTILSVLVLTLMLTNFVNAQQPQEMTRLGFVKEILRVMDVEIEQVASSPFRDISNKEDILYLGTAFNKKIVSGHGGLFNPQSPVTNEQAVIMLVRALGVINIRQDEASKTQINFSDASKISDWARPYVAYAVKYGLIDDNKGKFNPQIGVTKLESEQILKNFKEAFVREGLTAAQILKLADANLQKYNTYKFKGSMNMRTNVKLPTGETQVVTSEMFQEGVFEAPETVYTISRSVSNVEGKLIEEVSEVFMKDRIMFIRTGDNQEWIQMNLNPMMIQLESMMGSTQQGVPQLSNQQLEAVGMYARYGEDIEIDGQNYYTIKVDLDAEAFMEMYSKIMDETFNVMFEGEMWEQMKKEQGVPGIMDEETFKATIKSATEQLLKNMNMEMMQKYYIHKEDKDYSKLMLKQLINMDLMGVETKVEMDGQYEYYGFNEKVIFPKIN